MSFCPKCGYSLDITKNIIKNEYKLFTNVNTFIDSILKNNIKLSDDFKINFTKNNLLENNKYKKKKKDIKEKILSFFEKANSDNIGLDVIYFCNHCGYKNNIEPGTILYSENKDKAFSQIEDDNDRRLKSLDNTLPRTKNYICENKDCITHNSKNLHLKEAVFYRINNSSYSIKYLCCVCKTSWKV